MTHPTLSDWLCGFILLIALPLAFYLLAPSDQQPHNAVAMECGYQGCR